MLQHSSISKTTVYEKYMITDVKVLTIIRLWPLCSNDASELESTLPQSNI